MILDLVAEAARAARALLTHRLEIQSDGIPYTFERLPRKKILNACVTEVAARLKPARAWGWPTHLMVEPSSRCNLRCPLCPVVTGLGRKRGDMDLDLFKRVIDELGDYLFTLLLWDWGEPFLNRSIYQMIAYAGARGIKTISSTNGHLFARPEDAARLVDSGLDTIIFAIDGVSQATYERYRQGGQLETALRGVRNVVARKREVGSSRPLVNLRFLAMRHNEHEIPRARQLARELGVDALTLKSLNPYAGDPYSGSTSSAREEVEQYLPRDPALHRFKRDPATGQRIRLSRNPCRHLWNSPSIHSGGAICACEYDPREEVALGQLGAQSFAEIWRGAAYAALRRRFRRNWQSVDLCSECSYAYVGGNCTCETMIETTLFTERPA